MKRKKSFLQSIGTKLIIMFLAVSIIPIAIIGILSNNSARKALEASAFSQLESVGHLKADQIVAFLERKIRDIDILSKEPLTLEAFDKLNEYEANDVIGTTSESSLTITSDIYNKIFDDIDPFFREFIKAYNFYDMVIIDADHGHILYTVMKENDFGTNLKTGQYRESSLGNLWREIVGTQKHHVTDFAYYGPSDGNAFFIGYPVFDNNNKFIGVIAAQISIQKINDIMQENIGLGETGETYLVGEDYLMRSDSRFDTESSILKKKVETESVKLGLQDNIGTHIINDYGGDIVLSYYQHLGLNEIIGSDFEWVIIAEIHKSEAFTSIVDLRNQILIIGLVIAIIVAIIAFMFSRIISSPLIRLTGVASSMAIGDLSKEIEVKSNDEIGELANSFSILKDSISEKAKQAEEIASGNLVVEVTPLSENDTMGIAFSSMIVNLRDQIEKITEGVNVLSSSSSEIMAMVSQLASGSAETATSVSETTSTVEEVKQTIELSNQKATEVSESAQKISLISQDGKVSIHETIEGMNKIKEQMESIASIVIQLSEKSNIIGEIAATVNDLSEQSNLLAVNASIEAAKAGEQGKGFTVVAQEIKNLAERSKESTVQIRTILADIQKGISNAVMATEQGKKVIDDGLELSSRASEVITTLAAGVEEASQASIQISASSQQQLIGIEQITSAMENIKEASAQNSSSIKQTEESVTELNNLGEKLKNIMKQYKLK